MPPPAAALNAAVLYNPDQVRLTPNSALKNDGNQLRLLGQLGEGNGVRGGYAPGTDDGDPIGRTN